MLEVGSVLDHKYKILSEIGRGGMSVVYLALNERANKTWAVKEVRKDGGNDTEVVSQGLIAETEMLKKLNHPNLPSIIDVIDTDESFIIVMDYIEGRSLQDLLDVGGAQPVNRVVDWAKQLCGVLGYLHSRKPPIIYRDLKPPNVMLRPDGRVILIDFGTAREYKLHNERDTIWLGTRGYAAPEQFGGRGQTDARTDIYNLGATMYHLLTGFSPADTQFVVYPLGTPELGHPELSGTGIEKIVSKCCQPDPAKRYQNCAELLYDLEHVNEFDNMGMRRDRRKIAAFAACAGLAVAGIIGLTSFKIAENRTIASSYDSYLRSAGNSSEFSEKIGYYRSAIDRRPAQSDAYLQLLEDIESDRVFTAEEKTGVENCLNHHGSVSGNSTNADYFRSQNAAGYDSFQFQLGRSYFSYLDNGYSAANRALKEVTESENLSDTERKIAQSLYNLTDYWVHLGIDNSRDWEHEDSVGRYNYLSYWNLLEEITRDPATIDEKTGGTNYSLAMYREVASQLSMNITKFRNAGVKEQQMRDVITAARQFMERPEVKGSDILQASLGPETEIAVTNAEQAIESVFGGSIQYGDTPPASAGQPSTEAGSNSETRTEGETGTDPGKTDINLSIN